MKDIQKDPIQTGQASAPQNDNTVFKVVAITLAVIFALPVVLVIVAFIFLSLNFDKVADWVDSHIDDWGIVSGTISSDLSKSASEIFDAATGKDVAVSKHDCWNIQSLFGNGNSASWLMGDVCNEDKMTVGSKDNGNTKSLFFSNGNGCLEVIFNNDFSRNSSYNYNGFTSSCGVEMREIELDFDDDDNDSPRSIENPLQERSQES